MDSEKNAHAVGGSPYQYLSGRKAVMPFPVSIQSAPVVWDTLPVAKLTEYPFAKGAYRPFSQARICFVPDQGLFIRMWSFEAQYRCEELEPRVLLEDSCMTVCLSEGGQRYLQITLNANAVACIQECGEQGLLREFGADFLHSLHAFTGEDLQGEYWGIEFLLPNKFWQQDLSFSPLRIGGNFQGNFYSTRLDGMKEHFGCFYPVHSRKPAFLPESFGNFQVIDY